MCAHCRAGQLNACNLSVLRVPAYSHSTSNELGASCEPSLLKPAKPGPRPELVDPVRVPKSQKPANWGNVFLYVEFRLTTFYLPPVKTGVSKAVLFPDDVLFYRTP